AIRPLSEGAHGRNASDDRTARLSRLRPGRRRRRPAATAVESAITPRDARKSHVIPANAGIQEATSLAEPRPFGSDDGPRLAPPHRGPWIPAFAGMTNWASQYQHASRLFLASSAPAWRATPWMKQEKF